MRYQVAKHSTNDRFYFLIEQAVGSILELDWSDKRSRKKRIRFVHFSSEVRTPFSDITSNWKRSLQSAPALQGIHGFPLAFLLGSRGMMQGFCL